MTRTTKGKTVKRSVKAPKPPHAEAGKPSKLGQEVKGIFLAAILVYILISLHGLNTGKIGAWAARTVTYFFGFGAKFVLALALIEAARIFAGRPLKASPERAGLFLLAVLFLTYLHIDFMVLEPLVTIPGGFREMVAPVGTPNGGGIIGAAIAYVSLRLFDIIGTYVVLIAGAAIGLIMVLNHPIRRFFVRILKLIGKGLRSVVYGLIYLVSWLMRGFHHALTGSMALPSEQSDQAGTAVPKSKTRSAAKRPDEPKPLSAKEGRPEAAATAENAITINAYQESRSVKDGKFNPESLRKSKEGVYRLPPLDLLLPSDKPGGRTARNELVQLGRLLEETLANFGIEAKVIHIDCGPVITRYELQPAPGIKVSRIVSLADDIALSLAASDIRIEAPIPGKAAVGIEVPNKKQETVRISEVVATQEFHAANYQLPLVLGKGVAGESQVVDLCSMPHLLIAGATGSGKSVCINNFIVSLLYRLRPDQLRILMIDPKRVELAIYDGIPHLLAPVITDPKKAAGALKWVVEEMETRYELFANAGVRNIDKYNDYVAESLQHRSKAKPKTGDAGDGTDEQLVPLPYVVVLIDELADLMMVASSDVEDSICRLAQMARAAGIHLVVATQRPSVDVITGLIKANIPARIAFAVSSQVDSRTILDSGGAERLIGKGDMLYQSPSASKTVRIQGAYISDKEIEAVAEFWKSQGSPEYENLITERSQTVGGAGEVDDDLFDDAVRLVVSSGQASISLLQRRFRIGHSRAARLMDMMELKGIVGSYQGSKPREVLVSPSDKDDF